MARIFSLPDEKDRQQALGALGGTAYLHRKAVTSFGPLITPKRGPGPDDWLAQVYEQGQSFDQYRSVAANVEGDNNLVVFQPIGGGFEVGWVNMLAELGRAFFPALRFVVNDRIQLRDVGVEQADTYDAWELLPRLRPVPPTSRYAIVAFLAADLYYREPEEWVVALSNNVSRLTVMSFFRLHAAPEDSHLLVRRAANALSSKLCAIASLQHCIYYECLLNGFNSIEELDRRPLHACPICLRKLLFCFDFNPVDWYTGLLAFFQRHAATFQAEIMWLQSRIPALQASLSK